MNFARPWGAIHPRSGIWLLVAVGAVLLTTGATLAPVAPFLIGAAIIATVVGVAILHWPWLGFALLVASVPMQRFGAIPAGDSAITLTRLCFPIAVVAFVVSVTLQRNRVRGHIMLFPFVALVVVMLVSAIDAERILASLGNVASWTVALVAFIFAYHFLADQSERRVTAFVAILAAGGVFEAAFGLIQSVLTLGPSSFLVTGSVSRAFGTFGQPNSYAGFLAIVFFPSFWLGLHFLTLLPDTYKKYRRERRYGMAASRDARWILLQTVLLSVGFLGSSVAIMSGIIASYSRGAWLGVTIAALATGLLYHRITRYLALLAIPLVVLVLLAGSSALVPGSISNRFTADTSQFLIFEVSDVRITSENFATVERIAHWEAGWRMFEDEPVLGVGAGNFDVQYEDYYVLPGFQVSRGHAHNYYIHTLAETGIVGLITYLTLIFGVLLLALRTILGMPGGFWRMLTLGALGTVVSVTVHNFVENLHVLNIGIVISSIWVLIMISHMHWRTNATMEAWN